MASKTTSCPYCQGTGFIRTNVYCRECGGSGKLTYYDAQIGKEAKKAANGFLDGIFMLFEKPIIFLIPGLIIYAVFKDQLGLGLGYIAGTFVVGAYLHAFNLFSTEFGKIHKGFIVASLALFSLLMADFTKIQEADMTIPCIIGFFVVNFVSFYKWYFKVSLIIAFLGVIVLAVVKFLFG
jgi:membrane protein